MQTVSVARLRDLCIKQAKTWTLTTDLLLRLPQEVLRDLYGIPSQLGRCIVLISDTPLQADGNMVSGAICGYHTLRREFLFGEYENGVFLDPLENTRWKSAVKLKEIVPFIREFHEITLEHLNETRYDSNPIDGRWIEALLYQQVTRWVIKNNCYFALKLTDEFLKLANKQTIKVRMKIN